MIGRTNLWVLFGLILIPSSIVHCKLLLLTIKERKQNALYCSLFYRLFVIQGILELSLLTIHLSGRILIRERLAGNEFIMSTNGGLFPMFYYYGTVYFFFHVQVWGAIVQSVGRFLIVCAPYSRLKQLLDTTSDLTWALVNTFVPLAILFGEVLQGPISFKIDKYRNAKLSVPSFVAQSNAAHSAILTSIATVIGVCCNALMLRAIAAVKDEVNSVRRLVIGRQLALVGCVHLLIQCSMTTCHLIVVFVVVDDEQFVHVFSHLNIIPALLLTFANPWMLLITDRNLRRRLVMERNGNESRFSLIKF